MSTQAVETSTAATATAATTLNHLFLDRVERTPDRVSLRRKVEGRWEDVTWRGYKDAATKIGLALLKLGLQRGERAAILSETRAEWVFCDIGILGAGGVTVPIYHSSVAEEVEYILGNAGVRFLFLENLDQWAKVQPRLATLPVERYVIFDTSDTESTKAADAPFEGEERLVTLDALLETGEGEDPARFDEACKAASPEDAITYIYTSGTTGKPKGVVLTHTNAIAECDALAEALHVNDDDTTLAFLPLAHVLARVLHWMQIRSGYVTAFAEAIPKVVDNMGEVHPTFFAAVPRIYEKVHTAVMSKVNAEGGFKKSYVNWALEGAIRAAKRQNDGRGAGFGPAMRCTLGGPALKKLKAGLKERTGGRIRFFVSGGAPLSPEVAFFLKALGFEVYEGYGLTETTAATHLNRPDACKIGTVGRPLRDIVQKIAEDGEILVKGPVIMREYYQRPDATAEVLKDGWFHTGDIGEIDAEGFLKITDRKKDLIITAAGKNIAPQNVENHLKALPLVSQVALFGDQRKFCVALVTVDEEAARKTLQQEGAEVPASADEVCGHPRIRELIEQGIAEKNKELPSYESVKYFEVLPTDFQVGEELTPTLKVKRRVVKEKYGHLVDALYSKNGG